ncbi:MAG: hypothetical protein QNL65_06275 [Opitutales bacterium]|jgi:hypothetical protein
MTQALELLSLVDAPLQPIQILMTSQSLKILPESKGERLLNGILLLVFW